MAPTDYIGVEVVMPSNSCGKHIELASNPALRVTRCPCGTVHVTLLASGVTVRMSSEALKNVTLGLRTAAEAMDEASQFGSTAIN